MMTIKQLRGFIRKIITEYGVSASGVEPKAGDKPYGQDIERGVDIHGFWYRSPGRSMGQDGDPFRPEDAKLYLGFATDDSETAPSSEEVESPEVKS